MRVLNLVFFLTCSLALVACGGGGSDNKTDSSTWVSVNAGADKTVDEHSNFQLVAIADPVGGSFLWRQLSGASLSGLPATTSTVTLTAPSTKVTLLYAFQVQYTSPSGLVRTDEVEVTVRPVTTAPVAVARIKQPLIVPVQRGQIVELSADSSYDPDADGDIIQYHWTQVSGPAVNLHNATSALSHFVAPLVLEASELVFKLTVMDDEHLSHSTDIKVPLRASGAPLYAKAGEARQVREFALVELDGRESQSAAPVFECAWSQVRGPMVLLQNPTNCVATFTAPDVAGTTEVEMLLTVRDHLQRQATDSVIITILNADFTGLADTGVTLCYDTIAAIPCGNAALPRQDAENGRDSVIPYLRKIGFGEKAFDFTKLDEHGDEVSNHASAFSCVRDNTTGLIWELKEPSVGMPPYTSLRAAHNRYSFVNSSGGNGGVVGTAAALRSSCPSQVDCGTETYVAEVNASHYCGGSNWRLPTLVELLTLVDYSRHGQAHLLDPAIFRYEPPAGLQNNLYYWTHETSAEGGGGFSAWVLNTQNGNDNTLPKQANQLGFVRLVRTP